jgi:hypothetical protein
MVAEPNATALRFLDFERHGDYRPERADEDRCHARMLSPSGDRGKAECRDTII